MRIPILSKYFEKRKKEREEYRKKELGALMELMMVVVEGSANLVRDDPQRLDFLKEMLEKYRAVRISLIKRGEDPSSYDDRVSEATKGLNVKVLT